MNILKSTIMKKILLILGFVLVSNVLFAQQTVFDKFDGMEDVKSVLVTKKMFQMMALPFMEEVFQETQL